MNNNQKIRKVVKKHTNQLLIPIHVFMVVIALALMNFDGMVERIISTTSGMIGLIAILLIGTISFTCVLFINFVEKVLFDIEDDKEK